MNAAVECTHLGKTYRLGFLARRVRALRGIDLRIEEGEVFGLIGPNGAGKSTTIKILLNLVIPTQGHASLFGLDVRDPRSRKGVGFVPEAPTPYEYLTGHEYLVFQGRLTGLSGVELRAEIARVLRRVDMEPHSALQIRRYSKGMVQRIMLAGALLGHPRLLILDEPTSGLDPLGRRLVRDIIVEERKAGVAVLFCTHIISDVESLCDRVALLIDGTIRRQGPIHELIASGASTQEIVVDQLDPATVKTMVGDAALTIETVGTRAIITVQDDRLQDTLHRILEQKGRILRIQPVHFTLEDAFLETMKGASSPVGGILE